MAQTWSELAEEYRRKGYEFIDHITALRTDVFLWRSGLMLLMHSLGVEEVRIDADVIKSLNEHGEGKGVRITIMEEAGTGDQIIRVFFEEPEFPGLDVFEEFFKEDED